jgi:hypothetical protein
MRFESDNTGFALATLAAMLFLATPVSAVGSDRPIGSDKAPGRCVGVNACKGQSSCRSARNSCKGQNACKGRGFVELTKEQCDQVGGSFEPGEKKS